MADLFVSYYAVVYFPGLVENSKAASSVSENRIRNLEHENAMLREENKKIKGANLKKSENRAMEMNIVCPSEFLHSNHFCRTFPAITNGLNGIRV